MKRKVFLNFYKFSVTEIVQVGTHEQLLADVNGKYYELWNAQAQYYTEKSAS